VDGPSLVFPIWLSYLDSFSDQKRKTMDPDRCAGGRGTGQKGRKVAGSPCTACKIRADTEGESV